MCARKVAPQPGSDMPNKVCRDTPLKPNISKAASNICIRFFIAYHVEEHHRCHLFLQSREEVNNREVHNKRECVSE